MLAGKKRTDEVQRKEMIDALPESSDRTFDGVGADVRVVLPGVPGEGPSNDPGKVEPGGRDAGLA